MGGRPIDTSPGASTIVREQESPALQIAYRWQSCQMNWRMAALRGDKASTGQWTGRNAPRSTMDRIGLCSVGR